MEQSQQQQENQKFAPGPLFMPFNKRVVVSIPIEQIKKYFDELRETGIDEEDIAAHALYVFPSTQLEDGASWYVPGQASAQGCYMYPSHSVLPRSEILNNYPIFVRRFPEWEKFFHLLNDQANPDKLPIYVLRIEAPFQQAFAYCLAEDMLRLSLKLVKEADAKTAKDLASKDLAAKDSAAKKPSKGKKIVKISEPEEGDDE